jgi:hypothetical protein
MAKMTAAVGADDLSPLHTKSAIHVSGHSTGDGVKVCRPAAAGLELVVSRIERRVATCAVVNAFRRVVRIVFAGAGALSSLFA